MPHTEFFIKWLADAYGMESALVTRLGQQLSDITGHPELEARLLDHLNRTSGHANMVQECIARLGGVTSSLDMSGLPGVMATLQGTWHTKDESILLKALIGDIAAESYEIAMYKALIAVAHQLGDEQTAAACQRILRDEQEMARWLTAQISLTVQDVFHPAPPAGAVLTKGDSSEHDLPMAWPRTMRT